MWYVTSPPVWGPVFNLMQVTRQMLIWVMPWLILRTFYGLILHVVLGLNWYNLRFDYHSTGLATMIMNGACWTGVLFGFIKTAADPGPWDWSNMRAQQPQIAQYGVQPVPVQPSHYAPAQIPQYGMQAAPVQPNYYVPPVGPPLQVQQQRQWG